MCGVVGFIYKDFTRRAEESRIRAMCGRIVHRGPDDEGVLTDGNFGMGMRRLSIVDLEGGDQPISNEDGSVSVVFNGEIYNYPDLKRELDTRGHRFRTRSDTEVLVHGYEEWGDDLPKHLNGMFTFSLWDARRRRLSIARDHVGIKPLYLFESDEILAFASEIKALFVLPEVERALDTDRLSDFFRFGYVPGPGTLFKRITKLLPATILTYEHDRASARTYWDLSYTPEHRDSQDWCAEMRHTLDEAVRSQLMSDVPLGAFLSGGLDSSSIVASMHQLGVEDISTYAIGFGQDDRFHSELSKAKRVARLFDTDHHEIVVDPNVADLIEPLVYHLDEPITDTSFLVTYLVSSLARQTVTVILSGVGGDEVFGGYRRYLWPQLDRIYGLVPGFVDRHLVRPLVRRAPVDRGSAMKAALRYARGYLDHVDQPPGMRYQGYVQIFDDQTLGTALRQDVTRLGHSNQVAEYYDAARADDPVSRMLYADLKTALVDSLLAFTDKMSMAVSLEARVPLLDVRVLELAARLPPDMKVRGPRSLKHVFRQLLEPRLPADIIGQKKQGFGTPISRWFRGPLRALVGDLLGPDTLARRGLFEPQAVSTLVDAHMAEQADHSEHILALLTLELWQRVFLDGPVADPPVLS